MSDDDYIHACWAMEMHGGLFAKRLAHLFYVADGGNRQMLKVMFNSYFEEGLRHYETLCLREAGAS